MPDRFLLILALAVSSCLSGQDFHLRDFGATGDSLRLVTTALQGALDAAAAAGGGTVIVPAGTYRTGTVRMFANTTLHLRAGARLVASQDPADYETDYQIIKAYTGPAPTGSTPVLIYAGGARNVSITGEGTIDGRARRRYEPLRAVDGFIAAETEHARRSGVEMKRYYKVAPYVCLVFLEDCENVRIGGVTLRESSDWTLHFKWCRTVSVDNVRIFSDREAGVNADGIDIDGCRDVTVSNCIIQTGDDAIVLKSTRSGDRYEDCVGITVSNCSLMSTSTALKIGTESWGDFRQILFSNCVIRNTNRGMGIIVRDGGTVSDVIFSDISAVCERKHFNWWGNGDPLWLVVRQRTPESRVGRIENVAFRNILARGQGSSRIEGFPGQPDAIRNIRFIGVHLVMTAEATADKRADYGFAARGVRDLALADVSVAWDASRGVEDRWRAAFRFEDARRLYAQNLTADAPPGTSARPAISLHNVRQARLAGLRTTREAPQVLLVTGAGTQAVRLSGLAPYGRTLWEVVTGKEVREEPVRE